MRRWAARARRAARAWLAGERQPEPRQIERILARQEPPDHSRAEAAFGNLQRRYPPRPEYGYDARSTWRRGVERSVTLTDLPGMHEPGRRVLEVGCGDGMVGVAMAAFGHDVTLTDLDDWRDARARGLHFVGGDGCERLSFPDGSFDLVCSFNSFEHLADPAAALAEALRVTRTGGLVYLQFGPLFCSAWGLHAYRTLRMPFPQFLFSEPFIEQRLQELGIWDLGKLRTGLQPLNRWRPVQFHQLWRSTSCRIIREVAGEEVTGLDLVREYPEAFRGRGLLWVDLVTSWIAVTLQRD
jgi:SAM-dependent methyltransferase